MRIGCCFSYVPKGSVTEALMKICHYLNEHPGWSEDDLKNLINDAIADGDFVSGVSSFNGRYGAVSLEASDVNNLFIAPAYFGRPGESVSAIDLTAKYADGVRFIFTNYDESSNSYLYSFALKKEDNVVNAYQIATTAGDSSGGSSSGVISVNGKSGVVTLSLSDIVRNSGAQVKLASSDEFDSTELATWNAYYDDGFRIVAVINDDRDKIDSIYILSQDENVHAPIPMATGIEGAYSPSNPPPYPVTSVNGRTGAVTGLYDEQNQPPYPVLSVNGRVGNVTGLYDADNPPNYPVLSVNGREGHVTGLYDEDNPPPYPVLSVNGQQGHVEGLYGVTNPPPYPVLSVNGEEGAVSGIRYLGVIDIRTSPYTLPKGLVLFILKSPYQTSTPIELPDGNEASWSIRVGNASYIYPISVSGLVAAGAYVFCGVTRDTSNNKITFSFANRNPDGLAYNIKNNICITAFVSNNVTIPAQTVD